MLLENNPGKAMAFMLIATVSATLMQVCVKFLAHIPVFEIIFFRSFISLVLSGGYLIRYNIPLLGKNKKLLVLRAVFGVSALTLFFLTIQKMPLATAVTLQYLSPFFSILLGRLILKEKFNKYQVIFFLVAIAGVVVMGGFDERVPIHLALLGGLAALFAGVAYNIIRLLGKTDHAMNAVFYFPLLAVPVMTIPTIIYWVTPAPIDWFWIVLMGLFTQSTQYYMARSVQTGKLASVTILKYLGIVFALAAGFFLFDELLSPQALLGIGLVIAAVIGNYSVVTFSKPVKEKTDYK